MISRRRFLGYSAAGVATLAQPVGRLAAQDQPITIGAVLPLTGALAANGATIKNALELAVEIVNTPMPDLSLPLAPSAGLPGLANRKIRVIYADSRGDPATGRAEADRLIEQNSVVGLTGAHASSVTATASLAAEVKGIPFVNGESSSQKLTERGLKFFFRTGPNDTTFVKAFFDFLTDMRKRGIDTQTVALLNEDSEAGATAAQVTKDMAATYKYRIVASELYHYPPSSLNAELLRIKNANPDLIFGLNLFLDSLMIVRTLKEMRWAPKAFLEHNGGMTIPDFLKTVGKDGHFFFSRASWALGMGRRKPLVARVNDLYRKRYGSDMDDINARSFTAILTLADAINRAGSTSGEAIAKALRGTSIPASQIIMPWPGVEFDEKGQNKLAASLMVQILDGEYKIVWPFDLGETQAVWPFPSWDKR